MFRFLLLALVLMTPLPALAQIASPASLFEAAGRGDLPGVSALLTQGVDVNARDAHGNTALAWAELSGDPETIEVRNKENHKLQAFSFIVWLYPLERGFPDVVTLLVNRGADVNASDSHYGRTPLIWAARNLQSGLVKLLLDKGANVNRADSSVQRTALMRACERLDNDAAFLLLDRGAQANAKSGLGETPLAYACGDGNMGGDVALVKRLLEGGADPNVRYKWGGQTALYWALNRSNGSTEIVRLLLAHGADANTKTDSGETLLQSAQRSRQTEIATLLQKAGAKE